MHDKDQLIGHLGRTKFRQMDLQSYNDNKIIDIILNNGTQHCKSLPSSIGPRRNAT